MTQTTIDKAVADWFRTERGITLETLEAFGIRTNDYGDVVIPYSNGEKLRPNPTKPLGDRPRFSFTKGKTPDLFVAPAPEWADTAFLVEGETDAMRLWQAFMEEDPETMPAIFAIGGIHTWRPEFAKKLGPNYKQVIVILDNDADYTVAERVNHVWLHQIRADLGSKAKRVRLPDGVKDVCEFFETFDLEMLRMQFQRRHSISRFRPLDLNKEPPPVAWLVEGWIARGDLSLLNGLGGLGKSWATMGLAVACVDGWDYFLGGKMHKHGRVLYIDEENPNDVVYHRLHRLGLQNKGHIRYLWNNGVRLDKNPDILLEEAIEFDPVLIVLDSLTRIHSKAENDVGEMAPLLNECIKPLARETGAAVVVIHHHDKSASGPRGSGDIFNASDTSIDAYATGAPTSLNLRLNKSRRVPTGKTMRMDIVDNPDGSAALEFADTIINPPF